MRQSKGSRPRLLISKVCERRLSWTRACAERLTRAARAAQALSETLWEALHEELADPRSERVAELSEQLGEVAAAVASLARVDARAREPRSRAPRTVDSAHESAACRRERAERSEQTRAPSTSRRRRQLGAVRDRSARPCRRC